MVKGGSTSASSHFTHSLPPQTGQPNGLGDWLGTRHIDDVIEFVLSDCSGMGAFTHTLRQHRHQVGVHAHAFLEGARHQTGMQTFGQTSYKAARFAAGARIGYRIATCHS